MKTGLDDFKDLLKEFRRLAIWATGGAAVPFAAQLVALSPPWPKGIVVITSSVELIALLFVYHFLKNAKRERVNLVLIFAGLTMALVGSVYLFANSIYTFEATTTKERFVKGYICTENAKLVFKGKCPDLDIDDLAEAGYEAERVWTGASIATTRVGLVALWLTAFTGLAVTTGSFVVFQTQLTIRVPRQSGRQKKKPQPAG